MLLYLLAVSGIINDRERIRCFKEFVGGGGRGGRFIVFKRDEGNHMMI